MTRHTALLVEDDRELADELGDLLRSIGHQVRHAPTQEEAEAILAGGGFCYVLLDLQIKVTPDSIKPRVEAGLSLLDAIRKRFPERNQRDHHALQVLVMSGHAKEHQFVVKAFQDGADDFLQKPLSENHPRIDERIRDALRKSGRETHEKCAHVATTGANGGARVRLSVTARQVVKRTEILLDEKSALLTNSSFLILLHLLAGRAKDEKGWVHKTALGASSDQGWKGVSRLRDEVVALLPKKTDLTENDKSGYYRLNPEVSVERVDLKTLESHWDGRVRRVAAELTKFGQA